MSFVAAELLTSILELEEQDLEETIKGIQRGLDVFESGRFRSFQDFAAEQCSKDLD